MVIMVGQLLLAGITSKEHGVATSGYFYEAQNISSSLMAWIKKKSRIILFMLFKQLMSTAEKTILLLWNIQFQMDWMAVMISCKILELWASLMDVDVALVSFHPSQHMKLHSVETCFCMLHKMALMWEWYWPTAMHWSYSPLCPSVSYFHNWRSFILCRCAQKT